MPEFIEWSPEIDWDVIAHDLREALYQSVYRQWTVGDVRLPASVHQEAVAFYMKHPDTIRAFNSF